MITQTLQVFFPDNCPDDRRVYLAALTARGEVKLTEAAKVHAADLRRAFAGVSAHDRRTLDQLLDRLRPATID
ncbi:MAG: hypothetical protein ACT4PP_05600 [Sporichthyaceae bacterium]